MRDPDRIYRFCAELCKLWQRVPDWRFGQFMCNTLGYAGRDPFFVEDDEMLEAIKKAMSELAPGKVVDNHIEGVLRNDPA